MILPIVMKLSIIIPVYNGEKTIERCLRSIFSQSVDKSEYEVIVVDDCSTDDTVKVIDSLRITPPDNDEYDTCCEVGNLVIVKQLKNARQGAARNVGVKIAKGEYIQYLDADDYFVDGALTDVFDAIDEAHTDILMFDSETQAENGRVIESLHYAKNPREMMSGEDFLIKAEVPWVPWLTVFRKQFLLENQIEFAEGVRFEDTDYVLKSFLLSNSVRYYSKNIVYHVVNSESTVHGFDYQKIKERFMTSSRISSVIEKYSIVHPKGALVLNGHNVFLYDSLLKRNLWRLGYAEIISILHEYKFKGDNATSFIKYTIKYPKVYSFLSQIVRPILLAMINVRKLLK